MKRVCEFFSFRFFLFPLVLVCSRSSSSSLESTLPLSLHERFPAKFRRAAQVPPEIIRRIFRFPATCEFAPLSLPQVVVSRFRWNRNCYRAFTIDRLIESSYEEAAGFRETSSPRFVADVDFGKSFVAVYTGNSNFILSCLFRASVMYF